MKKIGLWLFLMMIIPGLVFAFTFEEYEWGKTQADISNLIKSKDKLIIKTDNPRVLKYLDKILDEDCTVSLEFTPKTKLLASIKIVWSDKNIGKDLKKLLTDKYGQYSQPNVFIEEYYWYGSSEYDAIVLDYDYAGTTVTYFGGAFQKQYEDEFDELMKEEKLRF